MQISDGENHFKIAPHQITVAQMEFFEIPKLAVFGGVGIHGLPQKRFKIHDANQPVVKSQTDFVAGDVFGVGDAQILFLINTGLQPGDTTTERTPGRFNGFFARSGSR